MLDASGTVIPLIQRLTPDLRALASGTGSERSVGGMVTKLLAADIAGEAGVETIIANGRNPRILSQIASGRFRGTRLALS
jgi:glutamate 5-kinase